MIIDEKGRLFGRVNVVDAAVVLALFLGAILLAGRLLGKLGITSGRERPVFVRILSDAITPETAASIEKGDKAFLIVGLDSKNLGTVSDVSVRPAEVRIDNSVTGKVVYAPDPKRRQVLLTVKGKGTSTDRAITISGNTVLVGDRVSIKTRRARFDGDVVDLKFGG